MSPSSPSTNATDRHKRGTSFKKSEVGLIPQDWGVFRIGEVMKLINGRAFRPADWKTYGTPIVRIQNLNDPSAEFNYYQGSVTPRNAVSNGDLLFAWSGTTGTSFGARLWNGPSGVLNQHIFKVIPDADRVTTDFGLLVLQRVQEDIEKKAHGFKASFVHVRKSDLVKIPLPVPTITEQRAIAAALSDVDALISALGKLIEKKRAIKLTTTGDLLHRRIRLGEFESKWGVAPLASAADRSIKNSFVGGPFGSSLKSSDYTDIGVRIIQLQNIGDGSFIDGEAVFTSEHKADELVSNNIFPGDLLLSKMGDPVARACIVPEGSERYLMCSDGIRVAVDRRRFDTRFLLEFINSPIFRQRAIEVSTGSTRQRIGLNDLRNLPIAVPELKEQQAIASILSDMDGEIATLELRREKTTLIKRGMMQELLTGKTRLI